MYIKKNTVNEIEKREMNMTCTGQGMYALDWGLCGHGRHATPRTRTCAHCTAGMPQAPYRF